MRVRNAGEVSTATSTSAPAAIIASTAAPGVGLYTYTLAETTLIGDAGGGPVCGIRGPTIVTMPRIATDTAAGTTRTSRRARATPTRITSAAITTSGRATATASTRPPSSRSANHVQGSAAPAAAIAHRGGRRADIDGAYRAARIPPGPLWDAVPRYGRPRLPNR